MRMRVQSLASLSGLKGCCELQCRSQMQLGSCIAVAVASGYSSDLTPSLGGGGCTEGVALKRQNQTKPRQRGSKREKAVACLPDRSVALIYHQHRRRLAGQVAYDETTHNTNESN